LWIFLDRPIPNCPCRQCSVRLAPRWVLGTFFFKSILYFTVLFNQLVLPAEPPPASTWTVQGSCHRI
jgi:hypothetical protein